MNHIISNFFFFGWRIDEELIIGLSLLKSEEINVSLYCVQMKEYGTIRRKESRTSPGTSRRSLPTGPNHWGEAGLGPKGFSKGTPC